MGIMCRKFDSLIRKYAESEVDSFLLKRLESYGGKNYYLESIGDTIFGREVNRLLEIGFTLHSISSMDDSEKVRAYFILY